MRIGIFGGSFNPVHQQHIRIALTCLDSQKLDEIWFMPVFQPVHKPGLELLDFDSRCLLIEKALEGHAQMRVTGIEKELGGPSYTVFTLDKLQKQYAEHVFYLIIGGDSCRDLHTWKEIDRLCAMTEFMVVDRPGVNTDKAFARATLHRVECQLSDVSSSAIRKSLAAHDFFRVELQPSVLYQILRHNMYDSLGEPFLQLLRFVEQRLRTLPEGLIEHIEGVAKLACYYAVQQRVDPRLALIAGLAHDLFRIATDDEVLALADSSLYELSELEKRVPMLAHGVAAAEFLKRSGLKIPLELLDAIRWHTSPVEKLSETAKVLVVADTLEPSRGIAGHDELRNSSMAFSKIYEKVLRLKNARKKG